jgi:hypothetical protein
MKKLFFLLSTTSMIIAMDESGLNNHHKHTANGVSIQMTHYQQEKLKLKKREISLKEIACFMEFRQKFDLKNQEKRRLNAYVKLVVQNMLSERIEELPQEQQELIRKRTELADEPELMAPKPSQK